MTAVAGRTDLPHFGLARLTPATPAIAGSVGTWTLTYRVGAHGIDDGGAFRVALHTTSDWSSPQFDDPTASDYASVTVETTHGARLEARFDPDLGVRPWKKIVQLRVRDAALWPGDTITITFGDCQGGSPGTRAQTFAGPMTFRCLVDAFGTGVYELVPDSPILPMIGGPAVTLHVLGPSDVTAGEPFGVVVRANDAWGNVAVGYRGTVRLTLPAGDTLEHQFGVPDLGVHRFEGLVVDEPGVHAIGASDAQHGLDAQPHPLRCHAEPPSRRVHWGDPHGQTEETVGIGTLDDYFTYARDAAALDFAGHQGNDFQITAGIWQAIREKVAAYHEPGRFVSFLGYEWSGNTPGGGDHNVHFLHDDGPLHRSSHWQVPDRTDEATDRHPVSRLYEQFRGREDVLLIPHVGGRHANLIEFFDDDLIPLVEICSAWGVFEWLTEDALRRGARIGFAGGSDDHTARPGFASPPLHHFGIRGGLTAALASACTREALWEALKARRTYATTGVRILLDVTANGHAVGSAFRTGGPVELSVHVVGTAPLWRVEVLRWPEVIYSHEIPVARQPNGRYRLRVGWTGARIRARHRLTSWDGRLTVEGGRLLAAQSWGFDHPEDGVTAVTSQAVQWRSETAGDWDGVVVEIEGTPTTRLHFETAPATFSLPLGNLSDGPFIHDAGGIGQHVRIEHDPGPEAPREVRFQVRDTVPPASRPPHAGHPYFVRVTQQDGHMAWSSPIYVTAS